MINRRQFLQAAATIPLMLQSGKATASNIAPDRSRISLSQWSFHRAILGDSKDNYQHFIKTLHSQPDEVLKGYLDPRDIVKVAGQLDVAAVDLVNVLFFGHANDKAWLTDFRTRASDNQVKFQVLMCDETGALGASSARGRQQAIENHKPWLETAAFLGCKQLRVNAYGDGTYLQQLHQCAESMSIMADLAQQHQLELLVENHGYASNNGAWLAMLIEMTNHSNFGAFTDLDNFFMGGWGIEPERRYDRIQGVLDLAPFTRGVSVKSHDFTADGRETTLDYGGLFKVFEEAGFTGMYSAEYEGSRLSEMDGTKATISYALTSLNN